MPMSVAIILTLLPFFVVEILLFFFAYKLQRKKNIEEDKVGFGKLIGDVLIVVGAMFVLNIILKLIIGFIPTPEAYQGIIDLIPVIGTLLGAYFIFKTLLLKEGIVSEKAKKIADQTVVYNILFGIILFGLFFVGGMLFGM